MGLMWALRGSRLEKKSPRVTSQVSTHGPVLKKSLMDAVGLLQDSPYRGFSDGQLGAAFARPQGGKALSNWLRWVPLGASACGPKASAQEF
jgi:hypothetical protein